MDVSQELCSCSTRGHPDVQAGFRLQMCPGLWCLWPGRSSGNSFAAQGEGGSQHPAQAPTAPGDAGGEPWEAFACPSRQVCTRFSTPNCCRRFPSQEGHVRAAAVCKSAGELVGGREFPRGSGWEALGKVLTCSTHCTCRGWHTAAQRGCPLPIPSLWANPLLFLPAPGDGITSSLFGLCAEDNPAFPIPCTLQSVGEACLGGKQEMPH